MSCCFVSVKMQLKGATTLEELKEEAAELFGLQAGQVLLLRAAAMW